MRAFLLVAAAAFSSDATPQAPPISYTTSIGALAFRGGSTEPILVFHPNGTVTGSKSLKPDAAAQEILRILYSMTPYSQCPSPPITDQKGLVCCAGPRGDCSVLKPAHNGVCLEHRK
jgi:hypothetical protein